MSNVPKEELEVQIEALIQEKSYLTGRESAEKLEQVTEQQCLEELHNLDMEAVDTEEDEDDCVALQLQMDELQVELRDCLDDTGRTNIQAKIETVQKTLLDLKLFEKLQSELYELEELKGSKKRAALSRISEIEEKLDELETKHRQLLLEKLDEDSKIVPPEAPENFKFLTLKKIKKKMKVIVTTDETWAKYQCIESTRLSGGESTLFWDNSKGGKARKRNLGSKGKIVEIDISDASAKIRFDDKTSAWFPVATLSEI